MKAQQPLLPSPTHVSSSPCQNSTLPVFPASSLLLKNYPVTGCLDYSIPVRGHSVLSPVILPSVHPSTSQTPATPAAQCYATLPSLQPSHQRCPSLQPAIQCPPCHLLHPTTTSPVTRYTFPHDLAIRYTLLTLPSLVPPATITPVYPCCHICHPLPLATACQLGHPVTHHCMLSLPSQPYPATSYLTRGRVMLRMAGLGQAGRYHTGCGRVRQLGDTGRVRQVKRGCDHMAGGSKTGV